MSDNENENIPLTHTPSFLYDSGLVPLTIAEKRLNYVDPKIISQRFYNNFNFSKLKSNQELNSSIGVTSPHKKEGKTLVASNMAVSLARGYRQRTVLVDLNFNHPQLHKIFGARQTPGLAEAMQSRILRVRHTSVEDLYLLSAGDISSYEPGIKDTLALREILYTLKAEFDFVILDMESIFPIEDLPVHFVNEIDGLLTVIDTQHTRQEHLEEMYKHIDENRVIGYIFNRTNGEH